MKNGSLKRVHFKSSSLATNVYILKNNDQNLKAVIEMCASVHVTLLYKHIQSLG